MTTPSLLAGVDRAAFASAFGSRLRSDGVPVGVTGLAAFVDALAAAPPDRVPALYWLARVTLVSRHDDLPAFDRVFDAAFRDSVLAVDPQARRQELPASTPRDAEVEGRGAAEGCAGDLPWHTRASLVASEPTPEEEAGRVLPELLPSAVARIADTPMEELDPAELALLGRWLEESAHRWPTRRSRRVRVRPNGRRVALRATIAASRRTGWEPMRLQHYQPVRRPLTVTLVCDVSQSMQSYASAYLHLMRVFARTGRAETFAFSTSLSRLTPALAHRSVEVAIAQAEQRVVDRYGGTHLASCLRELLTSRHGQALRGGVLVVASDGWDSDPPELLAATMARLRRRSRRVVWLNPRAAAPGFEPRVGSMSAALPYCDAFLPAHTLRALPEVFDAIAGVSSRA
ncbi:VWA domain-containing protein [Nocardioides guangzhouensis]|uniref:VWA domain-containing protein n=1 Tax=Nocardioides guangzhouensis TaxID=2497878 RepID=A0A4Q4ZIX8_9ACTN|nr:VWA domain-containing protein [Nocardioides guangzhouensis]RYP88257.1 VWA domain-containing protein [Nocardioides guangzhouensis]